MALHHGSMTDDGSRRFRIGRIGGEKTGEVAVLELLREKPQTDDTRRRFDTRTKPDGKSWTFEVFTAIDGYLVDVYKTSREIQGVTETILMCDLKDGIDLYRIELGPMDGRYSLNFMSRLCNEAFKMSDRLRLAPYAFVDKDGKNRIGVNMHSGANKLDARRADNEPGFNPPEATQTVFKGATMWDFTPVAEYLYEWVRFNVLDEAKNTNQDVFSDKPEPEPREPIDDLPF